MRRGENWRGVRYRECPLGEVSLYECTECNSGFAVNIILSSRFPTCLMRGLHRVRKL